MATVTIINGTAAQVSNVNAAGIDVPADSVRTGIVLTAAELDTLMATAGIAVTKDLPSYQERRDVARAMKYRQASAGVAI